MWPPGDPECKTVSHWVMKTPKPFSQAGCLLTHWVTVTLSFNGKQRHHTNYRHILDETPAAQTYQKHKIQIVCFQVSTSLNKAIGPCPNPSIKKSFPRHRADLCMVSVNCICEKWVIIYSCHFYWVMQSPALSGSSPSILILFFSISTCMRKRNVAALTNTELTLFSPTSCMWQGPQPPHPLDTQCLHGVMLAPSEAACSPLELRKSFPLGSDLVEDWNSPPF